MVQVMDRTRTSQIHGKIHNLRGEHFRHLQNQNNLPRTWHTVTHNSPTLPADLLADSAYSNKPRTSPRDTREALFVAKPIRAAQPSPPIDLRNSPAWRAEALSLIIPAIAQCHAVPPLTLLCLEVMSSSWDVDLPEIVQFIPSHLRLALLRWAAVHRPLTSQQLHVLSSDGHVAGELIVVGPKAVVREDYFSGNDAEAGRRPAAAEWESDDNWSSSQPMHTCVFLSTPLSLSILSTLPATLTTLALINIPNPVSLHRLPMTCPLVESLDLSYNGWLAAEKDAQERLGKLQWSRWHQLRTLGLRKCNVPKNVMIEVNKGRWDDVQVVV
ncbi:hypothetical protein R3P38DRAFT_2970004 [Favolaschia claudopus]|uniref:Uncharacterized protein n=1 Tax=Favolaschia claudopus TaxID=2862362 RepID=A0AAW0B499_9AGAR